MDDTIKQLLETAKKKQREIGSIENYQNKTNLSFPWKEGSNRETINLNVVSDIRELVTVLSFLKGRNERFDQAAKELDVRIGFKWGGYSYEDWREDIQNRVNVVNLKARRKELGEIEKQLDELMSPEMKKKLKLEELKKKLEG